ncbi:uncharacterized protein E0L32_001948 [Thyridium curvatum]|uniref:MARVEL domain-containing protein n=1 Tax=Thyridium curvatum TaxID=1093900 RepID=A0A507ANI2_9PEZI|nr:uncharacterized protein E0L32_001731 [Thyridium curvatum]XP_030990084.1 uncharacterized protein E0L32_001948 [Thyridium curvatum]TPX08156.1 hypothetical protein E0L32_001731 [Thyridium curvatum]TPX08373.1 hypothetical protein E0L32_001948 [Thyridium curvatum]
MWDEIEFNPERVPLTKLILHVLQFVMSFVIWCLEIAVFRGDGAKIDGNNGWTFAVCFLSIPAWIYLIGAPRFPRTRKLAEPHAMIIVDAVFTFLWLSAFATQASYNTKDSCGNRCSISKAIVGLGVMIFLLFCVTTFLSIYTLKYYQFNGHLPGYDRGGANKTQNIDPDKAAFSMAPHDEEAYAPVNMNDHDNDGHHAPAPHDPHDPHAFDTGYGYGEPTQDPYSSMGSRRRNDDDNPFDDRNKYAVPAAGEGYGAGSSSYSGAGAGRPYAKPAVSEYDDDQPVQFPAGNYDRTVQH